MRMMTVLAVSLVVSLVAAGSAHAQAGMMKLSATMDCPKTDPAAVAEVGDAPGHTLALMKTKCTFSKGELAGAKLQTEEDAFTSETTGSTARDAGYGVITLAGNDKAFVRFQGTTTFGKNNAPVSGQGTWSFTGGTGKAKGVKGKGSYKGTFKPDGSVSWQVDGDYEVAAAPVKK